MAKINVYGLKRPARVSVTRTFETPGGPLDLTFQRLSTVDYSRAYDRAEELIVQYVTGDEATGKEPVPFFPVGEQASEVTDSLCRTCAQFEVSQPEGIEDRYTAEEFIAIANGLDPETWIEIRRFFGEVNKGGQHSGNASRVATGSSSELPTGRTESDTRN